jgi:hypothetical protein
VCEGQWEVGEGMVEFSPKATWMREGGRKGIGWLKLLERMRWWRKRVRK